MPPLVWVTTSRAIYCRRMSAYHSPEVPATPGSVQSQELGGFPLPAYLNWQAGVTFTRKMFNLDLRYYDTNLSKENCFVFTGDPNARLGGSVDPVTNPEGLTSRWCSATFVAKFSLALN